MIIMKLMIYLKTNLIKNFDDIEIIFNIEDIDKKYNEIENIKICADFLNWGFEEMTTYDNKEFVFHYKF